MCANMLKSTIHVVYLSNRMWGVHVVYLSDRIWGVHVWMYACVATHITYIYLLDAYIYLVSFPEGGLGTRLISGGLKGSLFLTDAEVTELEAKTEEVFHQGLETMKDGISVCYVNWGQAVNLGIGLLEFSNHNW